MTFLVQFIRFRRGVPEVIRTLYLAAAEGSSALEGRLRVRLCDPGSANRNMQSGEGAVATANDLHWNERG